ncbi:MAG: L-serine ammonia-lyase, iron-sulfur-dependent subunit beta [Acutalibacteraceae bacterium]
MNIFGIIGPVMVGPSSSHTAGAVKIGYISRKLLGEKVMKANILLHGSFYETGSGHGTDKALLAGILGMKSDDTRIPQSHEIARTSHLEYSFGKTVIRNAHPNSVKLELTGESGKQIEVVAASVGGGEIRVCEINGLEANFSGEHPTLVVHNLDQPGHIMDVVYTLSRKQINIGTMQLYRNRRGGDAIMVIECDEEVSKNTIEQIKLLEGTENVTYLSMEG